MASIQAGAILLKNRDRLTDQHVLLINLEEAGLLSGLNTTAQIEAVTLWQGMSQTSDSIPVYFGLEERAADPVDCCIVTISKSKPLNRCLVAYAHSQVKPGGEVWLAGHQKAGIKSQAQLLESINPAVKRLDNARHCVLFTATALETHLFSMHDWIDSWTLDIAGQSLKLASLPGVFADGRLDDGSRLLLDNLPDLFSADSGGRMIDFGAGCGVLSCWIHGHTGAEMIAVDHDAMAIAACRRSFEWQQVTGEVMASDGLPNTILPVDVIVTNPPFHQGVDTAYEASETLIARARRLLKSRGRLIMVANHFLDYPTRLASHFHKVKQIASDARFQVIEAQGLKRSRKPLNKFRAD